MSCDGYECELLVVLDGGVGDALACELASLHDVGGAEEALLVEFVDGEDGVVGVDESVALVEVEDFVDLSGEDESVVAHEEFVGWHGRDDFVVEAYDLDEFAAVDVGESGFGDGLSDVWAVGWHEHLDGVFGGLLEGVVSAAAYGQELLHGEYGDDAHEEACESGYGGGEEVHLFARVGGVESGDDEVGRCADEGADAAHSGGVAQWDEEFGGGDVEFLAPHLHDADEEGDDGGVAQDGAESGDGQHEAYHGAGIVLGRAEEVAHDPLEHTGLHQSCQHDEEHADEDDGGG